MEQQINIGIINSQYKFLILKDRIPATVIR